MLGSRAFDGGDHDNDGGEGERPIEDPIAGEADDEPDVLPHGHDQNPLFGGCRHETEALVSVREGCRYCDGFRRRVRDQSHP